MAKRRAVKRPREATEPQSPVASRPPAAYPQAPADVVEALRQMLASQGWAFMSETLRTQVELVAGQIVAKVDLDGNAIDERAADRLRDRHSVFSELLAKPQQIIDDLLSRDAEDDAADENDPYPPEARGTMGVR